MSETKWKTGDRCSFSGRTGVIARPDSHGYYTIRFDDGDLVQGYSAGQLEPYALAGSKPNKHIEQRAFEFLTPALGIPLSLVAVIPIAVARVAIRTLLLGKRPASRIGRMALRTASWPFRRIYRRTEKSLGLALDVLTVAGTLWCVWQYGPGVYNAVTPVLTDAYTVCMEFVKTLA